MPRSPAAVAHSVEHGMFVRTAAGADRTAAPVLFIHGLGESGLCFEPLLERTELDRWTRLVPGFRGYGRSVWPDQVPSLEGLVDHLAAWLEDRCIGAAVLVGHSLGGALATLLAERYPREVAGVVSVDGNVSYDDCAFSGPAARLSLARFVDSGFAELRDKVYRRGVDDPAARGYYASLRLADPRAFHRHAIELVALSRTETLADRLRGLLADRLRGLAVPSRYIVGCPHGASARSRELLASAKVDTVAVSPSGHWPFIDQPDAFTTALVDLLRQVPATREEADAMDLDKLTDLKQKLADANNLAEPWRYFLKCFGKEDKLVAQGSATDHPFLIRVLAHAGKRMLERYVEVTELRLTGFPEHHFIHGSCRLTNKSATVLLFTDIDVGLVALPGRLSRKNAQLARFSTAPVPGPDASLEVAAADGTLSRDRVSR